MKNAHSKILTKASKWYTFASFFMYRKHKFAKGDLVTHSFKLTELQDGKYIKTDYKKGSGVVIKRWGVGRKVVYDIEIKNPSEIRLRVREEDMTLNNENIESDIDELNLL